jgi:CRISPR/Cas system CSM-associated protein Csm3 (group 7 of RAMP superfamily)
MKNHVIERIFIRGVLTAVSPISCGSGENDLTDKDLITDHEHRPFVPATTLAGVIRHTLLQRIPEEREAVLAALGHDENPALSAISFLDAPMQEGQLDNRDGIRLDPLTRTAENGKKYDYQVVASGARFTFRMEVASRIQETSIRRVVAAILQLLQEGIRLGAKTRRGLGHLRLSQPRVMVLEFGPEGNRNTAAIQKWIDFDWEQFEDYNTCVLNDLITLPAPSTWRVAARFLLPGSMLIRSYSVNAGDPDASHIHCNHQPVIPGSSWNGAIRHAIHHLLDELEATAELKEQMLDSLFGFVKEDKRGASQRKPKNSKTPDTASASRLRVAESVIHNSKSLRYCRNKIDRFTGGVVESALFDETPVYTGQVELTIEINEPHDHEKALVLLAIKDIGCGIQPIGGGANVGRGILELESLSINEKPIKCHVDFDGLLAQYGQSLAKALEEIHA